MQWAEVSGTIGSRRVVVATQGRPWECVYEQTEVIGLREQQAVGWKSLEKGAQGKGGRPNFNVAITMGLDLLAPTLQLPVGEDCG